MHSPRQADPNQSWHLKDMRLPLEGMTVTRPDIQSAWRRVGAFSLSLSRSSSHRSRLVEIGLNTSFHPFLIRKKSSSVLEGVGKATTIPLTCSWPGIWSKWE